MPFTPYEAQKLGEEAARQQVGDLRVARAVTQFRERFGFETRTSLAKATGLNYSYLGRIENGYRIFGKRSLVMFMIGAYELVMATQPQRRLEFVAWLFDEFLPTVHASNTDLFEKREQIIEERRHAKAVREGREDDDE